MVKNLPVMQETWVRPPSREDPLEKGMATHSSTVAWRIPKDRGAWLDTVLRVAKSRTRLSQLTPSLYSVFSWMICGTSHRLQVCQQKLTLLSLMQCFSKQHAYKSPIACTEDSSVTVKMQTDSAGLGFSPHLCILTNLQAVGGQIILLTILLVCLLGGYFKTSSSRDCQTKAIFYQLEYLRSSF